MLVNARRLTLLPAGLLIAFALWAVTLPWTLQDGIDAMGRAYGYDFIAFWSAGHLALEGRAADAYGFVAIHEAHQLAVPGVVETTLWHYPLTFFAVVTPFAALPYPVALLAFLGLTGAFFFLVMKGVVTDRRGWLAMMAAPAAFLNAASGQNAFLVAGLFALALLLLDRRPILAGVCIGLLAIKPHLASLFPLVLLAQGRWRAFGAAAVTAVTFVLASTWTFGWEAFEAFLANAKEPLYLVDQDYLRQWTVPSTFAAMRMLGFVTEVALAIHALVAGLAAVLVWRIWRAEAPQPVQFAALCAAALTVPPYLFFYDFVLMLPAIGWLAMHALRTGLKPGEDVWLAVAWIAPTIFLAVGQLTNPLPIALQIGPLAPWILLALCARRAGVRIRSPRLAPATPAAASASPG